MRSPSRRRAFGLATILVAALLLSIPHSPSQGRPDASPAIVPAEEGLPGPYFTENAGQIRDSDVRFTWAHGGMQVGFTGGAVLIRLTESPPVVSHDPLSRGVGAPDGAPVHGVLVRVTFPGSSPAAPMGVGEVPTRNHFFLGRDPTGWRTDVRSYGEVVYRHLYPGIDLAYRAGDTGVKYEFRLDAGADPAAIRIAVEGADSLRLDGGGLAIDTPVAMLRDTVPVAYQGAGEETPCRFALRGPLSYGFDCPARDAFRALTIDPVVADPLVYGTFLGGSMADEVFAVAADAAGNAYVAGSAAMPNFPTTPGAFDTTMNGTGDAFVSKLSPDGGTLLWSTFLGGNGSEGAYGLALGPFGRVYVTGVTESVDFPVSPWALDTVVEVVDAFVVSLNRDGNALVYSTFLGGEYVQLGTAITVDGSGCAYVTGVNGLMGVFPVTPGAIDHGPSGAFVAKIASGGDYLFYGAILGGEAGAAIAVDSAGRAFVAGVARGSGFPVTPGAFDTTFNGGQSDGFVANLLRDGSDLVFATYLGGGAEDIARSIAVDASASAYVSGWTNSTNFPVTQGAFAPRKGGATDAFAVKFTPDGNALVYGTFLGGAGEDQGSAIAVDPLGRAYVTGLTMSTDFPTLPVGLQPSSNGGRDAFLVKIGPGGNDLLYSTYLGGAADDHGNAVALDGTGAVVIAGRSQSTDFPTTPGAYAPDPTDIDAFVVKLRPVLADLEIGPGDIVFSPQSPVQENDRVTIDATIHNVGDGNASDVRVRFLDGPPPASPQIGMDVLVTLVPAFGAGIATVVWIARPPGLHEVCVVVDPFDAIGESNESNNVSCSRIKVLGPPGPDLAVSPADILLSPSPPYLPGDAVRVDAVVRNMGRQPSIESVARFHDGVPPAPQIGADQPVPPMAPNDTASVSVTWTAAVPGPHALCVVADPDNLIAEEDESNNTACVRAFVAETRPDYVPVEAQPSVPVAVGLSLPLTLSLRVLNAGNASAPGPATLVFHNESSPGSPFATFVIPPLAAGGSSSSFAAAWSAPAVPGVYRIIADLDQGGDVFEWNETNNRHTWTATVVPGPGTALFVGEPHITAATTYVTSSTPLRFTVSDPGGTGIRRTVFRWDAGPWVNHTGTSPITLPGEGEHRLEWFSEDFAGNVEITNSAVFRIDDTPPVTSVDFGSPRFAGDEFFVTSRTPVTLTSADPGAFPVGLESVEYRIDGGSWVFYSASIFLGGDDGPRAVEYRSRDRLGNVEPGRSARVVLDDSPPESALAPASGEVTKDTLFSLSPTDAGSGVSGTEVRVDGAAWSPYAGPFTLIPGHHTISYRSTDNLGNVEPEKRREVDVGDVIPAGPAPNYKPIVALAFALLLAVFGAWSSRRRPWGGGGRRAVLTAFAITGFPFVLAEAMTGVASALTGVLPMPPLVGIGTLTDLSILLAGVLVIGLWGRMPRPHGSEPAGAGPPR